MGRDEILNKSKELFLKHGVKTIGMDDIANALRISKKTIYQHFSSKDELVKITIDYIYNLVFGNIYKITGKCETPIHEYFEIVESIDSSLGGVIEDTQCMFELKKYYPELKYDLERKRYFDNRKITKQNLEEGIKLGLYRDNIDIDFLCTQYFVGSSAFHTDSEFLDDFSNFSHKKFNIRFLEYYLRAIVTPKGLEILENILLTKNENEI